MTMQRAGMAARVPMVGQPATRLSTSQVKAYVNAEPWTYYDERILSAGIVPPDNAAFNFAQFVSPLPFFNARTVSNAGYALTNMNDTFKMDADFLADTISVDVYCDQDAVAGGATGVAIAFVESIVNFGVLKWDFGTVTKLVLPVIKCPSGGGVVSTVKSVAAARETSQGNNGLQSGGAKRKLSESILFRRGTTFSCQLIVDDKPAATSTLARIQAITALATTAKAGIRINLEGVRGTPLLQASPGR
jgi:hypothetical protein